MNEKYEFTGETKQVFDDFLMGLKGTPGEYSIWRTIHRIRAKKDFGDVKKGDIGGWIENEENLDSAGDCWVYDQAIVCEWAVVYGDAKIKGKAKVWSNLKGSKNWSCKWFCAWCDDTCCTWHIHSFL